MRVRTAGWPRPAVGVVLRNLAPALVGTSLVVPSIVWVVLDRSVWPWDPAWYGEVSVDLWSTLRLNPEEWPASMVHAFGAKPPAIAWLGQFFVPFGYLIRDQEVAMLLSIIASQATTVGLIYAACRRLGTGLLPAIAAGLVVAAAPLFVSMSHEYFAEPIQTVSIAWCLFVLASAQRWPLALTSAHLAGVLALAMLAKLSSPAYLVAPVIAVVVLAFAARRTRDPHDEWALSRHVLVSGAFSALLVAGAVAWYSVNIQSAVNHARNAGSDSGLYGVNRGFANELVEWFGRFIDGSFLPHFGLTIFVLVVAAVAIAARTPRRIPILEARVVAGSSCLFAILLVLALFASQPNQEARYLLPLMPMLAVSIAVALSAPRSKATTRVAVAVLTVEFALVTLQGFGHPLFSSLSYHRLVAPARDNRFHSHLESVVDTTCTPETANRISIVGVDYPWLNHNTLELLAFERHARQGRKCYYTSLGYAETSVPRAWKRVRDFNPPFFISIDYGNPINTLPHPQRLMVVAPNPFNAVNRAVFRRLLRSQLFELVPGSRHDGFVILRARVIDK